MPAHRFSLTYDHPFTGWGGPLILVLLALLAVTNARTAWAAEQVPVTVEAAVPGAPITLGVPFPQGTLQSPDHVRVLTPDGREVPSQITTVTTWQPADPSIKWAWVFFFAEEGDRYVLEYGEDVRRMPIGEERIRVVNNMREGQYAEVDTGPLRLRVNQGAGGFIDRVELDLDGDGFDPGDVVATGPEGRGSFLDLVSPDGRVPSSAHVVRTWVEKGSGPLHLVLRVEGEYRYARPGHPAAPFTLRIHAYAGRPFVRVLHTFTYTGDPDTRPPLEGEHAALATQDTSIVDEEALVGDARWTQPGDRIEAAGLALDYLLDGASRYETVLREGPWWEPGTARAVAGTLDGQPLLVLQDGPRADWEAAEPGAMEPNASPTERLDGFAARVASGGRVHETAAKADGWLRLEGDRRGVSVGIRHFFKEYPKALSATPATADSGRVTAYLWPRDVAPMSFARFSADREDGGMVDNFATGLAKTSEAVYYFHEAGANDVAQTMRYVLDPPVAHAPPAWYADSRAFGAMASYSADHAAYERGLTYKYAWWHFNQQWEPWYGMFNYGDGKTYLFGDQWYVWTNNEPATDLMWWMAFMRTGDRDYYLTAEATSRHTMDVDNVHWPAPPVYVGDDNDALTYWQSAAAAEAQPGTPYRGMGRRHGFQHWTSLLSAHVWVPGWVASYYLAADHRALEVARQTADLFTRRIWGEHGLTGRRLYLSVWNLAEVYDATKDARYRTELDDRVDRMLRLQDQQGGNLILDRYGYSQSYAVQGLGRYLQLTGEARVRDALVRHARYVRDVPPRNHEYESFLASISPLLKGYELSGEESLLREAVQRAQVLRTDALPDGAFGPTQTQAALAEALEGVSHLPGSEGRPPIWKITNGLRIFGWTHAYNVPYLIYWLQQAPSVAADASD